MRISLKDKRTRIWLAAAAAVILVIVLTVMLLPSGSPARDAKKSTYQIQAEYSPSTHVLRGSMTLNYLNQTGTALDSLSLHLYPNAFASQENAPFPQEWMELAYPNGFSAGGIEVTNIKANGKEAQTGLKENNQILNVKIPKLNKNRSVKLEMDFTITLPNASGRFGYSDFGVNLGNWYPIVCGYDEGFVKNPYYSTGDPFFSESALYEVSLTLPQEYTLASTGVITKKDQSNPLKTVWNIQADNVRDFACAFSTNYKLLSEQVGNTIVYSYFTEEETGKKALDFAVSAVKIFNELYGEYPYPQYTVAESDFFIGGMEFPNIVFINKQFYKLQNLLTLEHVVVHETAHQWWYGTVGNNQVSEAFIDEGLAEYSTMVYYKKTKTPEDYRTYFNYYISNNYRFAMAELNQRHTELDMTINKPVNQFEDYLAYETMVYSKTALMLDTLNQQMGDEAFFKALKSLQSEYQFKTINTDQYIAAFKAQTNIPVDKIIESWLSGKVVLN